MHVLYFTSTTRSTANWSYKAGRPAKPRLPGEGDARLLLIPLKTQHKPTASLRPLLLFPSSLIFLARNPNPPLPMASSPWEDEGASSASDRDDALDEDMEALRRACLIAGRSPSDLDPGDGGESSDSEDDLDLLRSIQQRFSVPSANAIDDPPIPRPLNLILPTESDEEDDFETLRAIQRRFVHYENGEFACYAASVSWNSRVIESEEADALKLC